MYRRNESGFVSAAARALGAGALGVLVGWGPALRRAVSSSVATCPEIGW